jgi:hypothetical protein
MDLTILAVAGKIFLFGVVSNEAAYRCLSMNFYDHHRREAIHA